MIMRLPNLPSANEQWDRQEQSRGYSLASGDKKNSPPPIKDQRHKLPKKFFKIKCFYPEIQEEGSW